jgi:hypothetical protein
VLCLHHTVLPIQSNVVFLPETSGKILYKALKKTKLKMYDSIPSPAID